jgi:subtilisin
MTWKKRMLTFATAILLTAVMSASMSAPASGQPPQRVKVLIGFSHQPGPAEQALVRRAGGTIKYTYHLVPAIAATVPENAISGLQGNPNVLRVEPDLVGRAIDVELESAWGVKRIGAGQVHDSENQGAGVKVAIVDSGVDYDHPDLDDNYVGGGNFVEPDGDPIDVYGHGTHVAGTACAENNDNGVGELGVVGVAPSCALYSLRVLDDNGYGNASDTIAAMEWAVENGIQVANLSLGWDPDPGITFKTAFDNAWNAGVVVVAAAGNSGNPPGKGNSVTHPAKYESVIAVAATDSSDARASFSSTGDQVELAAPGAAVYSTWNDDTGYYDPQPVCGTDANGESGCYKYGSGTSMASPHVAGTAALILAANPTWSNDQVRAQLRSTADDLGAAGWDPQYGYGLVDAGEAAVSSEPVTDVGITAVDAPGSAVQGDVVDTNVTVANVGTEDVTSDINVTLASDSATPSDTSDDITIGTQTVSGGLTAGTSATLTFSWDTTSVVVGDHILSASHDLSDADSNNDSESAMVSVQETASSMHVGDLDGSTHVKGKSGKWEAFVSVTIHDENHNTVAEATVSGTWSGDAGGPVSGVTGSDGTVTFSTGEMNGGGSVNFTVDNVTHIALTYNATLNHDPDGDSDGTTITISKP